VIGLNRLFELGLGLAAALATVLAAGGLAAAANGEAAAAAMAALDADAPWKLAPAGGGDGYDYLLEVGEEAADSLVIASQADSPLRLKIYAADGHTTTSGQEAPRPAGEKRRDAGGWIRFGDPGAGAAEKSSVVVEVKPGESVTVPFSLKVPAEAAPGDHAAGIVSANLDGGFKDRPALAARVRVAGQLRGGLEVSDLKVTGRHKPGPLTTGHLTVSYKLTNTGNARMAPREVARASGPAGIVRSETKPSPLPELLPGSHLVREARVPGVFPLFRTSVEVEVDGVAVAAPNEPDVTARARTAVWSVPWLWLGVLLILAAAVLAAPLARGGRREA
jgi:hypothetical protein